MGAAHLEICLKKKPNTIKNILREKPKDCLANDCALEFSAEDFPKDSESTIVMRNRTKKTKLESHFQQRKLRIVSESDHTVTMDFKRGRQIISKRDIAKTKPKSTSYSPKTIRQRGDSKSLERKIAALKETEQRATKSAYSFKQKTATKNKLVTTDHPENMQNRAGH